MSQLRRALGDPAAVPGGAAGYALVADTVDALDAARLAAEGAARLADGDPPPRPPPAARACCCTQTRVTRAELLLAAGHRDAARELLVAADRWYAASGAGEDADLARELLRQAGTPS